LYSCRLYPPYGKVRAPSSGALLHPPSRTLLSTSMSYTHASRDPHLDTVCCAPGDCCADRPVRAQPHSTRLKAPIAHALHTNKPLCILMRSQCHTVVEVIALLVDLLRTSRHGLYTMATAFECPLSPHHPRHGTCSPITAPSCPLRPRRRRDRSSHARPAPPRPEAC